MVSALHSHKTGIRIHLFVKMNSKSSSLLFLALLCAFSSISTAFNITKILSNYPEYSTFENLLVQTGLAQQINSRRTITVLAVDNSAIGDISGKPLDVVKRILSAHVILDYYDQLKFSKLQKASSILTTLYQTTGIADDQQGFLNVTKTTDGIKFGSASKGAPLTASLVKSVTSQPYNISVLEVSGVIEAPGIENIAPPPPPSPGAVAAPKKAPAAAPPAKTPAKSPAAKAPAPSNEEPPTVDAPSEPPTEAAASPADVPTADAVPVSSPPEAETPTADDIEAPSSPKSGSSCMYVGGVAMVMGMVACVMVL